VLIVATEAWSNNWAWGLLLIVLTVLVHAFGLVEIRDWIALELPLILRARRSSSVLAVLMVVSVLLLLRNFFGLQRAPKNKLGRH
jgi:hypothetical protein